MTTTSMSWSTPAAGRSLPGVVTVTSGRHSGASALVDVMSRLRDVPLSALDLATVTPATDARTALQQTRELAQHVERFGFTRFWLAEHHNMPGIASSSPAILIGHVADA